MKKKVSLVCCILAAIIAVAPLAACNNNPTAATQSKAESDLITAIGGCSDTYAGSVSEETYKEEGDAAEAFVRNEILGADEQTQVTVTKAQSVAKEEAEKSIPAEFTKDAVEFKKAEVAYGDQAETSTQAISLSAAKTDNKDQSQKVAQSRKVVVVYLIKYGEEWKYFTPKVEVGNQITKSYYDSIFNAEKYKNCTMESVLTMDFKSEMALPIDEETTLNFRYSFSITVTQVAKYTAKNIYFSVKSDLKQDISSDNDALIEKQWKESGAEGSWKDALMQEIQNPLQPFMQNNDYYIDFLENDTADFYLKTADDQNWKKAEIISVNDAKITDLYPFANQYAIDYTFFSKTDTGCAVEKDSLIDYFQSLYGGLTGGVNDLITFDNGSMKFFVSDGVLSAMLGNIEMKVNDPYSGNVTVSISSTVKVTNYGTTTVVRPEGVPATDEQ